MRHRRPHRHHASRYRRKFHLYRSRENSILFGVCGGIAEQYDWSPWAVRGIALLLQLTLFPWLIVAYLIMGLVMKPAPHKPFENFEEEELYNSYQASRSEALQQRSPDVRSFERAPPAARVDRHQPLIQGRRRVSKPLTASATDLVRQ
jgi:phage shock protein C